MAPSGAVLGAQTHRALPFGGLSGVMALLVSNGHWIGAGLAAFGGLFLLLALVLR